MTQPTPFSLQRTGYFMIIRLLYPEYLPTPYALYFLLLARLNMITMLFLDHFSFTPITHHFLKVAVHPMLAKILPFYLFQTVLIQTGQQLLFTGLIVSIFFFDSVVNFTMRAFPWSLFAFLHFMGFDCFSWQFRIAESAKLGDFRAGFYYVSGDICQSELASAVLALRFEHAHHCIVCVRSFNYLELHYISSLFTIGAFECTSIGSFLPPTLQANHTEPV